MSEAARQSPETLRLFLALDPPDEARAAIAAWQRANAEAAAAGGWRAVREEQLHVTLAFLGNCPPSRVADIERLLAGVEAVPVTGRLLGDPVPLPRRRPRLMAIEVASEEAPALQASLAAGLREEGLLEPERRPFWPHVTVFRRSPTAAADASRGARIAPLGEGRGGHGHAFGFVRVALYRSQNRPEGSTYSRLAARDLPRPGGNQEEVN